MKIGIANDHHGILLKNEIINYFKKNNIDYINYGSNEVGAEDYVDYAVKLCDGINLGNVNLGILICGTGIGMSVVANKINGIVCAKVSNINEAKLSREHNGANVIAIGENTTDVINIVDTFINTQVSLEERHVRRREKIKKIEDNND